MTEHTFGIVGAGGMGKAIVCRLTTAGNTVVVTDNDLALATAAAADAGAGQPGEAGGLGRGGHRRRCGGPRRVVPNDD